MTVVKAFFAGNNGLALGLESGQLHSLLTQINVRNNSAVDDRNLYVKACAPNGVENTKTLDNASFSLGNDVDGCPQDQKDNYQNGNNNDTHNSNLLSLS